MYQKELMDPQALVLELEGLLFVVSDQNVGRFS